MGTKYCMNYDSGEYEWIDEDGNVFLLFSRKEAQEKLKL